eukprot:CAMPEP_0172474010 /NCGR_PEP_ID=MMETSP1065-20121228/69142_1 /TAXON_ID=265537 /ORGANISM="Amphiprora paludosa, Strain CCMP125" /LENGTH=381 /DNA_ID=CAMNT_0013232187 /DNA_START=405 /DNA_END=1550 /DNA_ORIENTATION=+
MKVKVGLVGLPNVGKSTLFNAMAQKSIAQAENFPFCTIEPNITPIPIPDPLLPSIQKVAKSTKALFATIELVDVAGLVKGASRGEGLGNRFLATVRECDLIIHIVRNYIDDDTVHVEGKVDPVSDAEVVNLELLLADEAHIERRLERNCPDDERVVLEKVLKGLQDGLPARSIGLSDDEAFCIKSMGLLTLKPVIFCFNLEDADFLYSRNEVLEQIQDYMTRIKYCDLSTDTYTIASAKLESELGLMTDAERQEYLDALDVDDCSANYHQFLSYHQLPLLIKRQLGLSLVYTGPGVPPERSRTTKTHSFQSTSKCSTTVLDLAGKLHGEIKRGFIRAEVTNAQDLIRFDTYNSAKEAGNIRVEGKEYIIQDGDVVLIKWKE